MGGPSEKGLKRKNKMIDQHRRELEQATDDQLMQMDQSRIAELLDHYDVPRSEVKGKLRCTDRSRVPGRFRFLFDSDGMFIGSQQA
jgi:hypothetical protein